MKLNELLYWLEAGHGVRGIPQTDASKCPRGLLINITDLTDERALKTAKSLMPTFADVTVVKLGDPVLEPLKPVEKPREPMTIREATSPEPVVEEEEVVASEEVTEDTVEDTDIEVDNMVNLKIDDSDTSDIDNSVNLTDTITIEDEYA